MPFGRMFGGFNAPPMNRPQAPMNRMPMQQFPGIAALLAQRHGPNPLPQVTGIPNPLPQVTGIPNPLPQVTGPNPLPQVTGPNPLPQVTGPNPYPQMGGGLVQTGEFGSQPVMMPASGMGLQRQQQLGQQQPPFGSGMPPGIHPPDVMPMKPPPFGSEMPPGIYPPNVMPMQQPPFGSGMGPQRQQQLGQQQLDQMAQNAYPPMASPGAGPNPQMGMLSNLNQMFSMAQQNPMQGGSPLQNNSSPLQSGGTPLQQSQQPMGNPGLF